jgi:hypothetical protein
VDSLVDKKDSRIWTYHFDLPARFPLTKFGQECCGFEAEGAVIHEGMRLLAREDGQYEVRFNVSTPAMPVLMRLQLVLYENGNSVPRTLTLPFIAIKPWDLQTYPDNTLEAIDPKEYLVSVRGYSQVIYEIMNIDQLPEREHRKHSFLLVKRIGTARFGSGFQDQSVNGQ